MFDYVCRHSTIKRQASAICLPFYFAAHQMLRGFEQKRQKNGGHPSFLAMTTKQRTIKRLSFELLVRSGRSANKTEALSKTYIYSRTLVLRNARTNPPLLHQKGTKTNTVLVPFTFYFFLLHYYLLLSKNRQVLFRE